VCDTSCIAFDVAGCPKMKAVRSCSCCGVHNTMWTSITEQMHCVHALCACIVCMHCVHALCVENLVRCQGRSDPKHVIKNVPNGVHFGVVHRRLLLFQTSAPKPNATTKSTTTSARIPRDVGNPSSIEPSVPPAAYASTSASTSSSPHSSVRCRPRRSSPPPSAACSRRSPSASYGTTRAFPSAVCCALSG